MYIFWICECEYTLVGFNYISYNTKEWKLNFFYDNSNYVVELRKKRVFFFDLYVHLLFVRG